MTSEALGVGTSQVEVSNIAPRGLWLLVGAEKLFLPFDEFPWFRDARVSAVLNVERPFPDQVRWPELDVDLTLDSIRHPHRHPLIAGQGDHSGASGR
ncbi:MAG: DUF2442 domain-containing protein [Actinobacteria bacterium]|nr:DUF2442 domain-containing protein [Actinomycetota bacterium]